MDIYDFEHMAQDKGVRGWLIELKAMQKDEKTRDEVNARLRDHWRTISGLLNHEDAKVRKNAALILGEAGIQAAVDVLGPAYLSETTLFVRPAYLTALGQLDYRKYMDVLKERLEQLRQMEIAPSDRKHLEEERHLLSELLDMAQGSGRHSYCGKVKSRLILVVKKGLEDIVFSELQERFPKCGARKMNGGVMVSTDDPAVFERLRTWQSMLFLFCRDNGFEKDGEAIARGIMAQEVFTYLNERHHGTGAWRFRVDVRTRDDAGEKAALAKKTAFALEALGDGHFLNSTSDYEIEFVLMEGKEGKVFAYLRLHTLMDHRFDYRQRFTAASMNPVSAALMIALCRPYFRENANILDPFCGVGTLLLERKFCGDAYKKLRIRSLYGLDIYGNAVDFGRENARNCGCLVNFIQRDFFDFTHSYLFDEVITDTPESFKDEDAATAFFTRFLKKLMGHLSPTGRVFIYTQSIGALREALKANGQFRTLLERPFLAKGSAWVMILEVSKEITNKL